jgi:hypothetical protein
MIPYPPATPATAPLLANPAFWSAVAAFCSFGAAVAMVLIQRRNLLESVRPELVLTGWLRSNPQTENDADVICYPMLRNVGRGAALDVAIWAAERLEPTTDDVLALMPVVGPVDHVPILAAGEYQQLREGRLLVWWKNVPGADRNQKALRITLRVACLDARNIQHTTDYRLLVLPMSPDLSVSNEIAAGVMLLRRVTRSVPLWRRRLRALPGRAGEWISHRLRMLRLEASVRLKPLRKRGR